MAEIGSSVQRSLSVVGTTWTRQADRPHASPGRSRIYARAKTALLPGRNKRFQEIVRRRAISAVCSPARPVSRTRQAARVPENPRNHTFPENRGWLGGVQAKWSRSCFKIPTYFDTMGMTDTIRERGVRAYREPNVLPPFGSTRCYRGGQFD